VGGFFVVGRLKQKPLLLQHSFFKSIINMRSYKIALILFSFILPLTALRAQPTRQLPTGEILQALEKLNHTGSVLYVAAHPDDENTRLLAYLANERKLRTGYLSLTRGDGGQNLIGKEQGELLGLIRTQELLAARRTDGAEQFFTRANDFGFSKNPEETFSIWNREQILGDVVWTIRRFKPDVIICRFPTTGEGGHGHHTASAILAQEAFDAAADPKRFPEQLKYTEVWQAKRLFWNTFNFGGLNTTAPNQVKINVGGYNPLLGLSYGEIAADSRSMHKSQGFGSARTRGESLEYFKQLKGDSVKNDVFEGINQGWTRLPATAKIQSATAALLKKYDPKKPETIVPDLVAIYKQLEALGESDPSVKYWKKLKLGETTSLLLACSGLWLEASATAYSGIPGSDININIQLINKNKSQVTLNKLSFFGQTDSTTALSLQPDVFYTFSHKEPLPANSGFSTPYWLQEKHEIGAYIVNDPLLVGKPENDASPSVTFDITLAGLPLKITRGLVYKATDPVKGEVYRPFETLPPATINFTEKVVVFNDAAPRPFSVLIKANANNVSGALKIATPQGWTVQLKKADFNLANKGDEVLLSGTVTRSANSVNGKMTGTISIDGKDYAKSISRIEYDHIPYQFMLRDAEANLVNIDLIKAGTNIGYIPGAGDEVVACLKQVGYQVTLLTDELLASGDLSKFNAIITGVRAYNINEHLQAHYDRLMDYVKNGGNLVVQYNTNSRVGPIMAKIGPYPFTVSRDRVTDENAPMNITNPAHSVLNYPNKITSKDFDNWIQERGIYFAADLDKHYETVFSINDKNEKPNDGSLIIAKYGKGNFVYTGLVFFRQLPAANPGAYRLFVNILSIPNNK